jgi:diaminopimelate epimerase
MQFYKYQGTGNDFILVDDRQQNFPIQKGLVAQLCHRRFGIGADGLILLQNHAEYDFRMVYFNADGNESSMCGNGGRCLVRFAHHLGVFNEKTTFLAVDGVHEAFIRDGLVHLKMTDVTEVQHDPAFDFLNTGSPHYVAYVQDLRHFDVFGQGKQIRYSDRFAPGGTNVNFVEQLETDNLFVRTYERGVEDETYSCGTGVTACALSYFLRKSEVPTAGHTVRIQTLGGQLQVSFRPDGTGRFSDIYLIGPAERVFEGKYPLPLIEATVYQ